MSKKILVVFGATGQQGGSVVNYVLNDPEMSKKFRVRAVTRDISKPAAQSLKQREVEVVNGDINDLESLKQVMQNGHTVFGVTTTINEDQSKSKEIALGKAIADTAIAAGVQYLIFSIVPYAGKILGGKYKYIDHFDAKAEVEEYVRTLSIISTPKLRSKNTLVLYQSRVPFSLPDLLCRILQR
jgi:uncharacterized protein YbjT (DUF2867 family)